MKQFSFITRQKNIKDMENEEFDLLIVGGGINGAGVARDASMRGMKVALVEANDFASGTSSKSSKLVHGGIRYLENMEFKLVFEALNERNKLFSIAPHLVHHLRFMIPLYKESRVGMFKMGLGMWLYDALALFQAPELHEKLNSAESHNRMPAIRQDDLLGSYIYSDGYMDDDRLVYETLRSANEYGAKCANYIKAASVDFGENKKIKTVTCIDQKTKEKIKIRAKHFISTVGPWTDELGHQVFTDWKNILRPTKGIHLTLPKNRLPLSSAVVMAAEKSNRIVFGIPRHEMIIIGTTDTDFKDSPDNVSTTAEDVQYLLQIVEHYFPGAKIKKEDIIASYAGVRPLVQDGSASEGKTSREHTILNDDRGITFVAGGKYTTYRLMSQQIVDKALDFFSTEEKIKFKKVDTTEALSPYTTQEAYFQSLQKNTSDIYKLLAERYGMEAENILQHNPKKYTYWQHEAAQAIETTMCLHLVDFYARRTHLFLADQQHGLNYLSEISYVFQEKLGWHHEQKEQEEANLKKYISQELNWKNQLK